MTSFTPEQAAQWLLSLEMFGMRFGLERMRRLMTALGSPQERFRSAQVLGTNGKSSTARMTAAILAGHGVRIGRLPLAAPALLRRARRGGGPPGRAMPTSPRPSDAPRGPRRWSTAPWRKATA